MSQAKNKPLDIKFLCKRCDPAQFSFKTTDELSDSSEFVGQNRALTAASFGIGIDQSGFNIFALGPSGLGKRSIIRSLLEKEAVKNIQPRDICYIHNFQDPRHPNVLFLTAGIGKKLSYDMQQLIDILRASIPAIFESKDYSARIKEIQEITRKKQDEAFMKLEHEAEENRLTIVRTAQGFVLVALKENNEIISEEEFTKLPKEEREKKEALMRELHEHLTEYLEKIPHWQKEQHDKIKEALKYFTMLQVGSAIDEVKKKYQDHKEVTSYLNTVQQAILNNPIDFRKKAEGIGGVFGASFDETSFNRYRVNVIVDNSKTKGVPIIYEDNPTLANLVGRIDQVSQFGALVTDFTLIRAGALHKANGGYLLLDAHKLLTQPFAWDSLKRALRAKEIKVGNIYQLMGVMGSASLEPDPVPLDIKIVLLGERTVYYLLCALDPDFLELFKVAADFDEDIKKSPENNLLFAKLLKNLLKKHNLRALTKEAVAAVIDHASRSIEDSQKISTHVRKLADLLQEADYYAFTKKLKTIDNSEIEQAIFEQRFRASRFKEERYEYIKRGSILIDTMDKHIGQVNGLSYIQLGGFAFGSPVRITARVSLGKGELVDIEREVKLGGPIHSKGVLILIGYLCGTFAKKEPLSLSASLVFEQSYQGIEGDSASVAEACALLSAIAEMPISQSLAITGSINQYGYVQAIGGVNEKIEGFFDVCNMLGLTGEQGVIIPMSNVDRLMLRKDVVEAASAGKFHIYGVETINDAIAILTGIEAGVRDSKGNFPENSVNGRVEAALKRFAKKTKSNKKADEKS